jgi:hypothetical protein
MHPSCIVCNSRSRRHVVPIVKVRYKTTTSNDGLYVIYFSIHIVDTQIWQPVSSIALIILRRRCYNKPLLASQV